MQSISHRTEVKHCSPFCSLVVKPELKLTAKNRQKLTAHGLKNPVYTKYANNRIYIYFFFPKEGRVSYKNTKGYRIKTLEVYRIKTLEVYCVKTLGLYRI